MINIEKDLIKYIFNSKNKIKINSKDIKKGDIFLALKGNKFHGNKFIDNAILNGAKFCITDKILRRSNNKKILIVADVLEYIQKIAIKKRLKFNGKVVGITGSAGKTTLKESLSFFLLKLCKVSFSKDSYNNKLGVLLTILNLDLSAKYAIFELGTNNFGEIKHLTQLVKPSQIFITNIQSTHLENFKTKNNIVNEKSSIFNLKYNKYRKILYLNIIGKYEEKVLAKSKKEEGLKTILVGDKIEKYCIKNTIKTKNIYEAEFIIKNEIIKLYFKNLNKFHLNNILFCLAFFSENKLNIGIIKKFQKNLKAVDGRGLIHNLIIKNKKIKVINESYNSNPDTMIQSIEYLNDLSLPKENKILILGNMNELGNQSEKMHSRVIKKIEAYNFKYVVLCGEFFRRAIIKVHEQKNKYVYLENKKKIMKFISTKVHKNDVILVKCSNNTEVNNFAKDLLKMRKIN